MTGEESVISEIQSNAESTGPVAEFARESLNADLKYQLSNKCKLDQLEIEKRMIRTELERADVQAKHVATGDLASHSTLYRDTKLSGWPNQVIVSSSKSRPASSTPSPISIF
jgi:hypothetical protein